MLNFKIKQEQSGAFTCGMLGCFCLVTSQPSSWLTRLVRAETQLSSARCLEITVTGRRSKVTAGNTTGTPSPADVSVRTAIYKRHGQCVKNVVFIKWNKISITSRCRVWSRHTPGPLWGLPVGVRAVAALGGSDGPEPPEGRRDQEQTVWDVPGGAKRPLWRTNFVQRGLQMVFRLKQDRPTSVNDV